MNILLFEQVREKLREGRAAMHGVLPAGERNTLHTGLDANVSAVMVGAARA